MVCDPRTHAEWWPDVAGVQIEGELVEGGEYLRQEVKRPFAGGDTVWVADRLDEMKEARFHCTVSGMYAHFTLAPAQDSTFVEAETGMLPTTLRWRMINALSGSYWRNWLRDTLDALPAAVARRRR